MASLKLLYHFNKIFFREKTTLPFCWIFSVCVKYWWHIRVYSLLQRRPTLTAPELFNSLYRTWTIRHLLQRTTWWSYLPRRIWTANCFYWILWSNNTRYTTFYEFFLNLMTFSKIDQYWISRQHGPLFYTSTQGIK